MIEIGSVVQALFRSRGRAGAPPTQPVSLTHPPNQSGFVRFFVFPILKYERYQKINLVDIKKNDKSFENPPPSRKP